MSNNDTRAGFDPIPFVINIPTQQDRIMDQLLSAEYDLIPNKLGSKRPRQILKNGNGQGSSKKSNNYLNNQKKEIHRESEKLRRQEMATQYSSLRSLLPLQYIKGKRAISDHVLEAVNYVNHLRQRIKELDSEREKLKKKLSNDHTSSTSTIGVVDHDPAGLSKQNLSSICCEGNDETSVTVGSCSCGVEVLIGLTEKGKLFPLSKLIEALDEQNLSVISCISLRLDQRLLYTIQCEVSSYTVPVEFCALRNLLMDVIKTVLLSISAVSLHAE